MPLTAGESCTLGPHTDPPNSSPTCRCVCVCVVAAPSVVVLCGCAVYPLCRGVFVHRCLPRLCEAVCVCVCAVDAGQALLGCSFPELVLCDCGGRLLHLQRIRRRSRSHSSPRVCVCANIACVCVCVCAVVVPAVPGPVHRHQTPAPRAHNDEQQTGRLGGPWPVPRCVFVTLCVCL